MLKTSPQWGSRSEVMTVSHDSESGQWVRTEMWQYLKCSMTEFNSIKQKSLRYKKKKNHKVNMKVHGLYLCTHCHGEMSWQTCADNTVDNVMRRRHNLYTVAAVCVLPKHGCVLVKYVWVGLHGAESIDLCSMTWSNDPWDKMQTSPDSVTSPMFSPMFSAESCVS